MNQCPSDHDLRALLAESLTAAEVTFLEEHLAGCLPCQERLQQLTSDTTAEHWRRLQAEPAARPLGHSFLKQLPELVAAEVGASVSAAEKTDPYVARPGSAGATCPDGPERIGRFVVTGFLDEGSFGRVYRGYDEQLEREVALKLAKPEKLNQPQVVERFLREARAAARLRHPHIVPLYEAGKDGSAYYIASAFISGQTLAATLAARQRGQAGPVDFARTAEVVRALAEALAYAHEQGIVHRDVKPANVMLDEKGQPLLMDFGLAARLDETERLTQEGVVVGTPLYMAPEQAEGRTTEVGPASDQYSLGVILYEMLCSCTPFKGKPQAVLYDHVHTEPLAPRRLDRRVPRDLETICLKALAKKPADRYPDCRALADDLRHWLEGEPIQARRASLLERTVKLARRKPALVGLVAAVIVLAAVVGVGSALFLSWKLERAVALQRTRDEVGGLVQQALRHEADRRWAEARADLGTALKVLGNQPDLRGDDLKQTIEDHLARVTAAQAAASEALDRRGRFLRLDNEALFYWTPFTGLDHPGNQARLLAAARAALDLYGLAGDDEPPGGVISVLEQDRPHLPPADHAELASACHELLLVWAEAAASGTPGADVPKEQRQQQARRALVLLQRARRLGRACGLESGTYALREARYQAWGKGEEFTPTPEQRAGGRPRSALDWFQAGLESYRAGRLQAAAAACEEALRREPRHFWARYVQALCQLQAGQWADGRASLTICLHQREDFVWARLLRGLAASELGHRDGSAELFAAARADLDQALQQDRTKLAQHVGLVIRGVLFIHQREWQEAIKDLQEAIRRKDDGYQAYLNLAQAHRGLREGDKALAVLTRAIGKAPGQAVLYEDRARLYQERKELAAARADFEQAVTLEEAGGASPRLAGVLLELGLLLERGGESEAALQRYDQALKIQPDLVLAHRFRGEALLTLGRRGEAAEALDHHLQLEREPSVPVYRARGLLYAGKGQYSAAVEMFTLALRKKPDDVETRCDRGWAYLFQDAARPALADFEAALGTDPQSVEALLGRGNARVRLRQVAEAVADAEAADGPGLDDRQLYNLTCIYALAAAQLELDARANGKRDPLTAGRIAFLEEKALANLKRTLDKVARERQPAYWREMVQTDPALTAIRRGPVYRQLAERYGRPAP
jgi:tetratricopeptide (TPR) repeat protein/tRNA A-37 threonylcarbamoyl transferase component Bud32